MTKTLFSIYWIATFAAIILFPPFWSDVSMLLYLIVAIAREKVCTSDAIERVDRAEAALARVEQSIRDAEQASLPTVDPVAVKNLLAKMRARPIPEDAALCLATIVPATPDASLDDLAKRADEALIVASGTMAATVTIVAQ